MQNPFGHMDLRVKDLDEAARLYHILMPALGLVQEIVIEGWAGWSSDFGVMSAPFFGIMPDPDHQPNASRVAFYVDSREDVDRIGKLLKETHAGGIEGPAACPEYDGSYYAVFFDDPSGNKLEVYTR